MIFKCKKRNSSKSLIRSQNCFSNSKQKLNIYFHIKIVFHQISPNLTSNQWTGYPKNSSINCGSLPKIRLGGPNIFQNASYAILSYQSLLPHFKIRIQIRFFGIDNWGGKRAFILLNNKEIFSKVFEEFDGNFEGNQCGGSDKDSSHMFFAEADNYNNTLIFKIATDGGSLGSWGIGDYFLSIAKCHPTCLSCKNQSEISCTTCYPDAFFNSNTKKCDCSIGFVMISKDPCSVSPCSACKPCHPTCECF